VERVKQQRLAALAQTMANPRGWPSAFNPILFGRAIPMAMPDGLGSKASIKALHPAALRAAQDQWLRPDLARVTVVGDVTMEELQPKLEARWATGRLGQPQTGEGHRGGRPRAAPAHRADRPGTAAIDDRGRPVLPVGRAPGQEALDLANEVLGGDFLSRLNTDLREEKAWTYGSYRPPCAASGRGSMILFAPVQTGRAPFHQGHDCRYEGLSGGEARQCRGQRVTDGNIHWPAQQVLKPMGKCWARSHQ
jgi:hypothetical protein